MYKLLITFLLFSISLSLHGQAGGRLNLKSGLQRCLDNMGQPIEDCWITTDAQGKAEYIDNTTFTEIINNLIAPSMITDYYIQDDSMCIAFYHADGEMYVSDTFCVHVDNVVFAEDSTEIIGDSICVTDDGVTTCLEVGIGMGLGNGILDAANHNGLIGGGSPVYTTRLPTGFWQLTNSKISPNTFTMSYNGTFNRFDFSVNSVAQEAVRTTGYYGSTGGARVWRAGTNAAGHWGLIDATTGGLPTVFQAEFGAGFMALQLQADGDIRMANYATRPFDSNPTNFAGWDATGHLHKYSMSDLIDTTNFDEIKSYTNTADGGVTLDIVYHGHILAGVGCDTIYLPNASLMIGKKIVVTNNTTTSTVLLSDNNDEVNNNDEPFFIMNGQTYEFYAESANEWVTLSPITHVPYGEFPATPFQGQRIFINDNTEKIGWWYWDVNYGWLSETLYTMYLSYPGTMSANSGITTHLIGEDGVTWSGSPRGYIDESIKIVDYSVSWTGSSATAGFAFPSDGTLFIGGGGSGTYNPTSVDIDCNACFFSWGVESQEDGSTIDNLSIRFEYRKKL